MLAAGRPAGKAAGKEEGSQAEDMPSGGDAAQTPGLPRRRAGTCVATVAGSVTVELSDGSLVTREFARSDSVEIVAPGKK